MLKFYMGFYLIISDEHLTVPVLHEIVATIMMIMIMRLWLFSICDQYYLFTKFNETTDSDGQTVLCK